MKNQPKDNNQPTVICKDHKQKCVFVCLHKSCINAFKIGCIRCRKDHAQHPNRLISINEFHTMYFIYNCRLAKPIKYLQNVTAFKLMNLKKKIEYIRNFRTQILQKEYMLMESNRHIKGIIATILQQHYYIREVVSKLDTESLCKNQDLYVQSLQKCKDFMAFNPVKLDLVFNNQVIKTSRVQLQKHLKTSHELIDSIRQFLLKIIEVLLANCAHQEDDDQIQFAEEGDNATTFNIFIKNRTDVSQNPNIKSKLQHQTFLQMFDEQKDALTKQVQMLQKQIDTKSSILHKIKSANSMAGQQSQISEIMQKSQKDLQLSAIQNLQIQNDNLKEELTERKKSSDSIISSSKLQEMREEYQNIIFNKQEYIDELKQMCKHLEVKIHQLASINSYLKGKQTNYQSNFQEKLHKQQQDNVKIAADVIQLQSKVNQLNQTIQKINNQKNNLNQYISALENNAQKQSKQFEKQKNNMKNNIEQLQKKLNQVQLKFAKAGEQIENKEKQMQKQKKRYGELQKMFEQIKYNNATSQKQLLKQKSANDEKQKTIKIQIQKYQKELDKIKQKSKKDQEKIIVLQNKLKELIKQIEIKNESIKEKDRQLKERQQIWQTKTSTTVSRIRQNQNEQKGSRINDNSIKTNEEQIKKQKEAKDLLQMSIKKNQQLKDKTYQLQLQIQSLRAQLKSKDIQKDQLKNQMSNSKSNEVNERLSTNRSWKGISKNSNVETPIQFDTVQSEEIIDSPKKDEPLKERKTFVNKDQRKQAYLQIKSIFKAVTEDMTVLEERLKENTVIEKVYLKQLQRKRTQNKNLKKQLQNVKVYGGYKQPQIKPSSMTPRGDNKQKNEVANPLNGHGKTESQLYITKKYMKVNNAK